MNEPTTPQPDADNESGLNSIIPEKEEKEAPSEKAAAVTSLPEPEPLPVPMTEEQFLEQQSVPVAGESHEESTEEHELEESDDYTSWSTEELVQRLEEYVNEVEVPRFKARIGGIREHLTHLFTDEKARQLEKFIEEGGNKDDFEPAPVPMEDRFHLAIKKFNKKRVEFHEQQEKQRRENLHAKQEILSQLKDLMQNEENLNKAFDRFHELQARWRSTGPVPSAELNNLQMTYKFFVDKFYDYIGINKELRDLDQRRNLESKMQICEQAEELLLEPSLNTALRKLHGLQDKWRETGPVPREQKNEIWDRFKSICDKLFDKRKQFIANAEERRKRNHEIKSELCKRVEAIQYDENWRHREWQEATQSIAAIREEWRKTGPAPAKLNDEVWSRFRGLCDHFFKAKNDFYHQRKQELAGNLQKKTELCIQAEALQNSTDWKTTTAELKRLQDEWKASGPVAEKYSDKIWKRFRSACDAFFRNKSEHFSSRDKEQDLNLVKKIELIGEIENFSAGSDSRQAFEELKAFQRRWSELGMVPLPKKEEINSRYKKAIDAHFDKLKVSSHERQKIHYREKLEHLRHSDDPRKMDHERRHLLNKISELKNEVQVWENNIGFFAKSKNAEALKNEFEEKIQKAKNEIATLKEKLNMTKDG